jgi:Dyp-type peroxidase family
VLFREDASALPGPLHCHEHFGFRDSISQPGIRGMLNNSCFLTPSENPANPHQGKPGQDLVWPGEFIFGYPGQDASKPFYESGTDPLVNPRRSAPIWARNGSFLVVRRLRQAVGAFHHYLNETAHRFGISADHLGAKLVGRWPSGTPIVRAPDHDEPRIGLDEQTNNDFGYGPGEPANGLDACAHTDPEGVKCPFTAHTRKVFPRDDTSRDYRDLDRSNTHTHRLLRRGIPFGPPSASSPQTPFEDEVDRGLMFLAYQVSIEDQFEFVTRKFANDHNFKWNGSGYDPIIGQNDSLPNRWRPFRVNINGQIHQLSTTTDWVIPTGGGYFFAPSLSALQMLAQDDHHQKQ